LFSIHADFSKIWSLLISSAITSLWSRTLFGKLSTVFVDNSVDKCCKTVLSGGFYYSFVKLSKNNTNFQHSGISDLVMTDKLVDLRGFKNLAGLYCTRQNKMD
jgi:hypothetical protein